MNRLKPLFFLTSLALLTSLASAQESQRWQQKADYEIAVEMDVNTHRFTGTQTLTYYNNSPDTLTRVFYHLFFNAFQPGSQMDVRSRTIADPDDRVADRISKLRPNEIGYQKVTVLKQNGKALSHETVGTVLEVTLNKPLMPGSKAKFYMEWEGQVPVQIRRSGRQNAEGVEYSMAQWYPKIAEYDYEGWHAHPYIGREFHAVWGDYDVKITIDKSYVIGGTGYLQNPQEIGHGYEAKGKPVKQPKGKTLTWHFKAPNVIDFMWGADPDFKHLTRQVEGGPTLHFFYQPGSKTKEWEKLPALTEKAFLYANKRFGEYPYQQFSVVQGGDGGMEYPMSTLITGNRSLGSLAGVTVHEMFHSWYQGVLASNEAQFAWMDEGFTSYASAYTMAHLFDRAEPDFQGSYRAYHRLVASGKEEALTTHSDHFHTNGAYSVASYVKGSITPHTLGYIMGQKVVESGMRRYFNTWKFRHPSPNDYKRVMEKHSGLELDWFFQYWVNTTYTVDYAVANINTSGNSAEITLQRLGDMPMPLDVEVTYANGSRVIYNIPLRIMRGHKAQEDMEAGFEVAEDWPWVYPTYSLKIPVNDGIKQVTIDPLGRSADVNRDNNSWPMPQEKPDPATTFSGTH